SGDRRPNPLPVRRSRCGKPRHRRTGATRLPLALWLLQGRRRSVRPRLRPHLRSANGRFSYVVHLWTTPVRDRGSGLGGSLHADRRCRPPLTIYGNGKQVRDLLFVEDLVRAFRLAARHIDKTAGNVYNMGGGPPNTVSIWHELGPRLEQFSGRRVLAQLDGWRPGDQPVYVSDTRKAQR